MQAVYLGRSQEQSKGVGRMKQVRKESQHKDMSPLWTTRIQACWNFPRSRGHASELSTQGTVYPLNGREDGNTYAPTPVPIGQGMSLGVLTAQHIQVAHA